MIKKAILILTFLIIAGSSYAEVPLIPYKDHLIIMVHGVNADYKTWVGQADDQEPHDKLYEYLVSLGCSSNVFVYSFSEKCGYIPQNILELSQPDFSNPANSSAYGGEFKIKENRSWIEQARHDYAQRIADRTDQDDLDSAKKVLDTRPDLIPSKILFVAHSMGNFAVRGYILSDELADRGVFDKVPGYSAEHKRQGFYKGDVAKVVFVDPTLKGSETPTFVYCNFVLTNLRLLQRLAHDSPGVYDAFIEEINKDRADCPELDVILAKGKELTIESLEAYLMVEMTNLLLGTEMKFGTKVMLAIIGEALIKATAQDTGINNPTELLLSGIDNLGKYMNTIGGYPVGLAPLIMYPDFLARTSAVLSNGLLRDVVGTYFAYVFEPNMMSKSIYGSNKDLRDVSQVKDSLNYQGMPRLMNDITLADINQKFGKNYAPVKYSTIVSDGSVDTNADRVRWATKVSIGKIGYDEVDRYAKLGDWIPEFWGKDALGWTLENPFLAATVTDDNFWKLKRNTTKMMSLIMAHFGLVSTISGDGVVSLESQRGDGIKEMADKKVYNQEFYSQRFEELLTETAPANIAKVEALIFTIESAMALAGNPGGLPPIAKGTLRIIPLIDMACKSWAWREDFMGHVIPLVPHLRATAYPNFDVFTKALYDTPIIKIDAMYRELKSNEVADRGLPTLNATSSARPAGLSILSIGPRPTANIPEARVVWPTYEKVQYNPLPGGVSRLQADGVGNEIIYSNSSYYQRMPTFDYTADNGGGIKASSILIHNPQTGADVWAKNINTKADKMILRGTLDDLTPRHSQTLSEYSFNFGAWQRLPVVNDYGNYELNLELAEGQNIVALRASNKAGYSSRQFLRIIKSSTPMLITAMTPDINMATNNASPLISFVVNNMQFESKPTTINYIDSLEINGVKMPVDKVAIDYFKTGRYINGFKVKYAARNLTDGVYDVTARMHDAYGHVMQESSDC